MRTLTISDPGMMATKGQSYAALIASLGAVGHWPMQETSGSTMTATVGPSGTYYGATLAQSGPSGGVLAPSFDGVDDYASVAIDLSPYSAVSVAFWLWWATNGGNDDLACEYTPNTNTNNGFYVDPNVNPNSGGGWAVVNSRVGYPHYRRVLTTRPAAAAWNHFVVRLSRSGGGTSVVVNGSPASASTEGSPPTVGFANSTLYLMTRTEDALYGNGRMCHFAVFPSWLSDSDAGSLYRT